MGLQGANKSAHWDGWEIENPLELYSTCIKTLKIMYKIRLERYFFETCNK